jgi:hypothetical protein
MNTHQYSCLHCVTGTVEIVAGVTPYSIDTYQCELCDSTYLDTYPLSVSDQVFLWNESICDDCDYFGPDKTHLCLKQLKVVQTQSFLRDLFEGRINPKEILNDTSANKVQQAIKTVEAFESLLRNNNLIEDY